MRVLFVLRDLLWLKKFKKSFNGNYKDRQFDFRKSPRSALGRFVVGLKYDIVLMDYGWSINGLKKLIQLRSPLSDIYIYSLVRFPLTGLFLVIKKDVGHISRKLRLQGAR